MNRFCLSLSSFALFFSLLFSCEATFSQVQSHTLSNGLKVLVQEDHRAPIAVSMVWYDVGSADEAGGLTGISHALEHLMFKGTPANPLGVFSKKIASIGGQENAYTSNDYTTYFEKIAAAHLATSFALEADRMKNLLLNPKEFAKEIQVIQEERRLRTDDNPQALTFERFLATAHLATPYHHPVIGWMSDLLQMTVEDAKLWYSRYYAPNNATLVVVGDVKSAEVFQLAERYFGPIPKKPAVIRKAQKEPPHLGKKFVAIHAHAQVPLLMLGYTVPTIKSDEDKANIDPYVLEVIAGILDAGDSSRFSRHLVREKHVASDIEIFYNLYARYQTQFIIYGTPSQRETIETLRNGIFSEITPLKTTLVEPKELARIKAQIVAQKIFERDSIFGQAMEIGTLETIGLGWQYAQQYVEKINQVTPQQIREVSQRYFDANNLTEAVLTPIQAQGKK